LKERGGGIEGVIEGGEGYGNSSPNANNAGGIWQQNRQEVHGQGNGKGGNEVGGDVNG
jgi:hypothetical protein